MSGNIRDAQSHLSFVKEAHAKIKKSPVGERRGERREEKDSFSYSTSSMQFVLDILPMDHSILSSLHLKQLSKNNLQLFK